MGVACPECYFQNKGALLVWSGEPKDGTVLFGIIMGSERAGLRAAARSTCKVLELRIAHRTCN